jgi:hypothetical protein
LYDYHADPIAILYVRSHLRLVVDLQTNIKAQQSAAYAECFETEQIITNDGKDHGTAARQNSSS